MMGPSPSDLPAQHQWFAVIDGKRRGPLEPDDLHGLRIEGKLGGDTLVWREGMAQWQPMSQVADFGDFTGGIGRGVAGKRPLAAPQPPEVPAGLSIIPPEQGPRLFESRILPWFGALLHALRRTPRSLLYAVMTCVVIGLGGFAIWRAFDLDAPVIEGRRIMPDRRIKVPEMAGLYAVEGDALRPIPALDGPALPPALSPSVDFLLKGGSVADPNQEFLLTQVECSSDEQFKSVRTMRCVTRPFDGHADCLRIIPAQELAPGWYELSPIGTFMVSPKDYSMELVNRVDAAQQSRHWDEAFVAIRTWRRLNHEDKTAVASQSGSWSQAILQNLMTGEPPPAQAFENVAQQILSWQPVLKQSVATAYRHRAEVVLKQGPRGVPEADALLQEALALDPASTQTVATVAWHSLSQWISEPATLGKDAFYQLWNYCENASLPETITASPAYQFAQALKQYDQGARPQALLALAALTTTDNSNTTIALAAHKVMAFPTIGAKPVANTEPVIFRSRRTGQDGLRIELLSTEVSIDSVLIGLHVRNSSSERMALSFAKPLPGDLGRLKNSPLYLLDDNGQKFDCLEGFIGGHQVTSSEDRGGIQQIVFEPDEAAELFARFPMVSAGAMTAQFVSPECSGQSRWSLDGIRLKAGPFEPPLPSRPLLHPERVKTTAVPVLSPAASISASLTTSSASVEVAPAPTPAPASSPTLPIQSPVPDVSAALSLSTTAQTLQTPLIQADEKPAPAESLEHGQNQMMPVFAQAKSERETYLKMRKRQQMPMFKESLFKSGEQAYGIAEQARLENDFSKASVYYKIATNAYQQAISAQ